MIYVDHASGLVHVFHQPTFTADETAQKTFLKQMAADHGVQVAAYHYLAGNGMLGGHELVQQLKEQKHCFSGTGVHHTRMELLNGRFK